MAGCTRRSRHPPPYASEPSKPSMLPVASAEASALVLFSSFRLPPIQCLRLRASLSLVPPAHSRSSHQPPGHREPHHSLVSLLRIGLHLGRVIFLLDLQF